MDVLAAMRVFVCAAECNSFAAAAREMGLARSVISTRIGQLEEYFGTPLFHRSARTTMLSELGGHYYRECRELVSRADDMMRSVSDSNDLSGVLKIQIISGLAAEHFSHTLMAFRARYPRIDFILAVNDRVIDPVKDGYDVTLQVHPPKSDLLIERRLFPVRSVLCASPAYLDSHAPIATPESLAGHDLANHLCLAPRSKWAFSVDVDPVEIPVKPVLTTNSTVLLAEFARSGAGVAYLPTMAAHADLQSGSIVRVLPDYDLPIKWLSAVYSQAHRSTVKVGAFVNFLRNSYPKRPLWDATVSAAADDSEETALFQQAG